MNHYCQEFNEAARMRDSNLQLHYRQSRGVSSELLFHAQRQNVYVPSLEQKAFAS